jgi:hypothetical protein
MKDFDGCVTDEQVIASLSVIVVDDIPICDAT